MAIRLFGLRPLLWPTLITVPAVLVTFGLGVWQVQRLFWKQNLIAERQARVAAPALDALPDRFDPERLAFRRVRITGHFLHGKELYRPARRQSTGAIGVQVITPFALKGGGYIFVDRGWVPEYRRLPDARRQGQVQGEVTIEGLLRAPVPPGWFTPDNQPQKNRWFFVDLAAMAKAAGMPPSGRTYYVDAGPAPNPGGYPVGGQTHLTVRNEHLQYAITWFALTVIGIVIYLLYHRRREHELRAENGGAADT